PLHLHSFPTRRSSDLHKGSFRLRNRCRQGPWHYTYRERPEGFHFVVGRWRQDMGQSASEKPWNAGRIPHDRYQELRTDQTRRQAVESPVFRSNRVLASWWIDVWG